MNQTPVSPHIGGTDTLPAPFPRVNSHQVLQGRTAVEIIHAGQRYVLRVTRENKLILTK